MNSEKYKEYYCKNKEKILRKQRARYYLKGGARKQIVKSKEWNKENLIKYKEIQQNFKENNKERMKEYYSDYYAMKIYKRRSKKFPFLGSKYLWGCTQ